MSEEQEVILCLEALKIGFRLNPDLKQENVENICRYIDNAITLIDNQQKETKQLKSQIKFYSSEKNFVSKVKIVNKIEELEKRERQLQEESFILDNYLFNKETIKRIVSQKDILKELLGEEE